RAARNWECYDAIVAALKELNDDESLLIQSGKPIGVFKTHPDAPRVLIANSNLVPKWATWEHFNELDRKGLMMFGQMTAGSWIYIGSQGIVQGTYETFAEAGRQHYGGELADKWILTAGLGGMGGAQPLAATMAGASLLVIECQPSHVEAMLAFHARGIPTVDYGNNIRQVAFDEGVENAFAFPGFVPAYIRPLFCEGKGPFRWVALSGDPEDIRKTDRKVKELFPDDA